MATEPTGMTLRDYQTECIQAVARYASQGGRRGLVALPTGTGKTVIFAEMARLARKGRVLVLAHREELLDQAATRIRDALGLERSIGVEQASRTSNGADIVVASVQTLAVSPQRLEAMDPSQFSLVIVDEAHHSVARTYLQALSRFGLAPDVADLSNDALNRKQVRAEVRDRFEAFTPDTTSAPLLAGFTATPTRTDGRGLEWLFDELVYSRSIREMMEAGWLCPMRGERVRTQADITGVKTKAGDYQESALSEAVNTPERNALVVDSYQALADGRQALVFAVDVQHTKDLCAAFQWAGVRADYVIGETKERSPIIDAYRAGDLQVLVNCMVLTEGFDAPETSCLVMARPTKSSLLYQQMLGRGTRIAEGKDDLLVIDLADTAKAGVSNINTMFGLPPELAHDNDSDVLDVVDEVDDLRDSVPVDMFGSAQTVDELREMADSFDPLQAATVENWLGARLAWTKTAFGYHLSVPIGRDAMHRGRTVSLGVVVDLLGRAELRLKEAGARAQVLARNAGIQTAIRQAEEWVEENANETLHMLDRKAKWRQDAPSPKQAAFAAKLGLQVAPSMTKGDVSQLIDAALAKGGPRAKAR